LGGTKIWNWDSVAKYQNKMSQPLKFALVLKERLVEAHSVLVLYGAGSGFESAPG